MQLGVRSNCSDEFTLVYGPLFPILQGRLQSWIVTIHEDNVPNNTVVNASKPINFGRYLESMPKLQTLAETYQKATKNKVTWPLKAGKQTKQGTQPLQGCPAKLRFLQFLRFLQKLWEIGEIAVFAKINLVNWYRRFKGVQQKLRFLQKLRKNWKNRNFCWN